MNEEKYNEYNLPVNYNSALVFLNKSFDKWAVIEAALWAIVGFVVGLYVCANVFEFESIGELIGYALVFALIPSGITIKGINDETLLRFLKTLIIYAKNRRTTFFNPRVKFEALSVVNDKSQEGREVLPREKLFELYNNFQKTINEKSRAKAINEQQQNDDIDNYYFEDDIGVVDKPIEYMTKKEQKEYKKMLKRKQKEEGRTAKKKGGLLSAIQSKKTRRQKQSARAK